MLRALPFPVCDFGGCLGRSLLTWGLEKEGVGQRHGEEESFRVGFADQAWEEGTYLCAHFMDQTLLHGLGAENILLIPYSSGPRRKGLG